MTATAPPLLEVEDLQTVFDLRSGTVKAVDRLSFSLAPHETLAIVGYRQPITAPEVSDIRGVNSTGVIRTLLERRMIRVSGRKNVVGSPFLYRTTREFLDYFGLKSLAELPPLAELKAMGDLTLQLALAGDGGAPQDNAATEPPGTVEEDSSEDDELSAEGGASAELVAKASRSSPY